MEHWVKKYQKPQPGEKLTVAEARAMDVLLSSNCATTKVIARRLALSPCTIHTQLGFAMAKLGAHNRAHAALLWSQRVAEEAS
jgi:DNA-binding NarL/FixJ family response regulator